MAKLISVADDVYHGLTRLKGKESYSFAIRHLLSSTSNKESILRLCGRGGIDREKVKELRHLWKRWSDEYA